MTDNRNDQASRTGSPAQQNQSEGNENGENANPQEGVQWDNYQTRSLSSEGGEKIEESDLLRADEASSQQPEHRNSNASGSDR